MALNILKSKIDFSSSVLEFRTNHFGSKTTLPSCVFSSIIVGVKNWFILKKSFFSIFYRFQTLLQKTKNDQQRRTALLRMLKKLRKRGSITFRLSNLVEEHLSYLWIYFGRLADVCYFRKWIFVKKSPKKGSIQKYRPPCLVDCAILPGRNPKRSTLRCCSWCWCCR